MIQLLRALLFVALASLAAGGPLAAERPPLRIGLTPVFLDDQLSFLRDWQGYLQRELGRPVEFVQRQTYREITDLILQRQIDAAWICGFPYVRHRKQLQLLAVPLFEGEPWYQSYLIVPASDHHSRAITDLRDGVFAFSDPDSNSGYLYPQVALREQGLTAGHLFRRTFFAWAHRNVVLAVADGLASGGAVDGYVWETLKRRNPELTGRTRVVERSPRFGFPPFVTARDPDDDALRLGAVLRSMDRDHAGRALLERLNLTGFGEGHFELYDGIADMVRRFDSGEIAAVR